jgi:hypothetical protein
MSGIASVAAALDSAVGATGGDNEAAQIAVSVLTSTEAELETVAATLMASLGVGQGVSTEA